MSEKVTVYQKPTCSTCRNLDKILRESGIDYDNVNYYVEPLSEKKIHELLKKMKLSARDIMRTKEATYKELNLADSDLSEEELVKLMVKHPELLQRPIVEKGSKAILGRPIENVLPFLKNK